MRCTADAPCQAVRQLTVHWLKCPAVSATGIRDGPFTSLESSICYCHAQLPVWVLLAHTASSFATSCLKLAAVPDAIHQLKNDWCLLENDWCLCELYLSMTAAPCSMLVQGAPCPTCSCVWAVISSDLEQQQVAGFSTACSGSGVSSNESSDEAMLMLESTESGPSVRPAQVLATLNSTPNDSPQGTPSRQKGAGKQHCSNHDLEVQHVVEFACLLLTAFILVGAAPAVPAHWHAMPLSGLCCMLLGWATAAVVINALEGSAPGCCRHWTCLRLACPWPALHRSWHASVHTDLPMTCGCAAPAGACAEDTGDCGGVGGGRSQPPALDLVCQGAVAAHPAGLRHDARLHAPRLLQRARRHQPHADLQGARTT